MTAVEQAVECEACPNCNGSGEVGTGEREHETGVWITRDCGACASGGVVHAELVVACTDCGKTFWAEDTCSHAEFCPTCVPNCTGCIEDNRTDAAYDAMRDGWALTEVSA